MNIFKKFPLWPFNVFDSNDIDIMEKYFLLFRNLYYTRREQLFSDFMEENRKEYKYIFGPISTLDKKLGEVNEDNEIILHFYYNLFSFMIDIDDYIVEKSIKTYKSTGQKVLVDIELYTFRMNKNTYEVYDKICSHLIKLNKK